MNRGNFDKLTGNEMEIKEMTIISDRRKKKNIV
jgi:hypothetical protein